MELFALERLRQGKNLLAFSGGSDSTALFYLLLQKQITFDIAIVNYNLRAQSKDEVAYAKELAKKYNKKIFIHECHIAPPGIEEKARKIRYQFFETIIKQEAYNNLITAHQLNDQFEWFMMQLAKGAGVVELLGMDPVTPKDGYQIIRPLLFTPKEEILKFLEQNKIHYFLDSSNLDTTYTRNLFRKEFCDPFMQRFAKGVQRSLLYLHEDKKLLSRKIFSIKKLFIAKRGFNRYQDMRTIDKIFKKLNYLLSSAQKEEIFKQQSGVIGGKIAFSLAEDFIFISPYTQIKLPKKIKELYRINKIPPCIRGYIYKEAIDLILIDRVLKKM